MYTTRETRYDGITNETPKRSETIMRYLLTIDATDIDALLAIDALFTDVTFTPSPDSSILTDVTFTATDTARLAYLARFDFDLDEHDDVFTALDA